MNAWFTITNPLISAAVGIIVGIVVGLVTYRYKMRQAKNTLTADQNKIFNWLLQSERNEKHKFRSTRAIASAVHLSEERVREAASQDTRVHSNTGERDTWSLEKMS